MPHLRFAVPLGVNSAPSAEPMGDEDRGACSVCSSYEGGVHCVPLAANDLLCYQLTGFNPAYLPIDDAVKIRVRAALRWSDLIHAACGSPPHRG